MALQLCRVQMICNQSQISHSDVHVVSACSSHADDACVCVMGLCTQTHTDFHTQAATALSSCRPSERHAGGSVSLRCIYHGADRAAVPTHCSKWDLQYGCLANNWWGASWFLRRGAVKRQASDKHFSCDVWITLSWPIKPSGISKHLFPVWGFYADNLGIEVFYFIVLILSDYDTLILWH